MESAMAIEQRTETNLLGVNLIILHAPLDETTYRFQNRHGAPPVAKAVETTVLSASHVAIKHKIKHITLQTEKSLLNS